jgi:beta-xylosidase
MTKPVRLAFLLLAACAPLAASAAEPLFAPVHREDFADPFVVEHKGEYIAYSTNRGLNLPMLSSRDLVRWQVVMDPANPKKPLDGLPELGAWARKDFTWAPEVMEVGGRWLLYYTARDRRKDVQCIGLAVADNPRGPYRDTRAEPFICQPDLGGTIDANPFRDLDGRLYVYFKNDGNNVGKPTELWGQALSPDGMATVGAAVSLKMTNDKPWEAHVIEAPTMVRTPVGYTMLYSANHYGWETHQRLSPYAMGYATCSGPLGPCADGAENPILHSYNDKKAGCLSGPGHQAVVVVNRKAYLAFHAWAATSGCRIADKKRYLYVAPVGFTAAGKPVVSPGLRAPPR